MMKPLSEFFKHNSPEYQRAYRLADRKKIKSKRVGRLYLISDKDAEAIRKGEK